MWQSPVSLLRCDHDFLDARPSAVARRRYAQSGGKYRSSLVTIASGTNLRHSMTLGRTRLDLPMRGEDQTPRDRQPHVQRLDKFPRDPAHPRQELKRELVRREQQVAEHFHFPRPYDPTPAFGDADVIEPEEEDEDHGEVLKHIRDVFCHALADGLRGKRHDKRNEHHRDVREDQELGDVREDHDRLELKLGIQIVADDRDLDQKGDHRARLRHVVQAVHHVLVGLRERDQTRDPDEADQKEQPHAVLFSALPIDGDQVLQQRVVDQQDQRQEQLPCDEVHLLLAEKRPHPVAAAT